MTPTVIAVGAGLTAAVIGWLLACVQRPGPGDLELAHVAMSADAPASPLPAPPPAEQAVRPIADSRERAHNQQMADTPETPRPADSLPVVRRGYDQAATDALVGDLEGRLRAALAERDAALARAADREQQLAEAKTQEQAVADALVVATRVRSESEREAATSKEQSMREAHALKEAGKRTAEEIVRAAEADAQRIIQEARMRSGDLEDELRNAGSLAEQTHLQLTAFLQSLRRFDPEAQDGNQVADRPTEAPQL